MWHWGVTDATYAALKEMIFTIFILPVYLVTANYLLAKKFNKLTELFILNALIILSCVFLSAHFHLKNWADSVGSVTNPDQETQGVMDFEKISGLVVAAVGIGIVFFRIHTEHKSIDTPGKQDEEHS